MKLSQKILLIFILGILISCSKTEENIPIINIDNLILTSDSNDGILIIDELANFIATGDDEVDYTDQAIFYVNQTEIIGSSYVFDTEGAYSVNASYGGVNSNVLDFNVIDGSERVLLIDTRKALRNQTVTFSLVDPEGNDITSSATFYVNNTEINGHTFSSSDVGDFEVYAEYELAGDTEVTEIKEFEVFIPKRKVVLEDYTGTWCGFCPRVVAAIDSIRVLTNDIAVVAIHETANSNPDPMHFPQVQDLKDEFGVDGLPAARINRTSSWGPPYETGGIIGVAGSNTDFAIAIKSQLIGSNLTVEVKVVYEEGSTPGDKLVVYLVENGILHDQTNYFNTDETSPFYGLGNPIPNFEHNDVLRMSLTQVFGDNITATGALDTYTRNFNTTIPSEYNANNLGFVVMVVSDDNTARNAQFADVNEDKAYE